MTDLEPASSAPSGARAGRWTPPSVLSAVRNHAFTVYLATVISVGVLLSLVMAAFAIDTTVEPGALLIGAALCLGADRPLLDIRFGHNSESFTWAEVAIVIGIFAIPSSILAPLAFICVLVFHLVMRRQLLKAFFNASCFTIGAGLAALVAYVVGGGSPGVVDARRVVGLSLGALAFYGWNSTAVAGVVALSSGTSFRTVYVKGLLLRGIVCVGNVAVGVGVLVLYQWSRPTVAVLPPLLLLLYTAYRGYLHAMQERDVWQQLESAARELNQLDESAVAEAAIVRAAQMLKADVVQVSVHVAGAENRSYVGDATGLTGQPGVDGIGDPLDSQLMLYVAPLEGPQGRIGLLRIGFFGSVTLTRREQQVLNTFAHAVSTTLQNAQLYAEMREHAEAKAYEAEHDPLTGLGNRLLLHDRADRALAAAAVEGTQCALLIIDLDHFKEINDTLGHAAGDLFLQEVGRRLSSALPHSEAVCRLGGDEFAVLLGGLPAPAAADVVAARLLEVLSEPVLFDGLRLSIEGSVGIACYPQDAGDFTELLQRADVALYQAKDARGSFFHYQAERDASSVQRLALAAELRLALARDELVVHFQPQYDLSGGTVVGAECLVRWQHPQRGLLLPGDFISVVEHSGLIRDFTLAVLDKGVAECATWTRAGRRLTVAVNLSARNLLDKQLPQDVSGVLARHGLAADQLILEITETTMMSELDVVESVLGQLRAMGVQLSVDDFGTGYSSLAFLQRVQVNEVKIDRSFVNGVVASDNDRALVRATVQLAHSLGARCVGEGVESREQYDVLVSLGCDYAQGYHLGRPVSADVVRRQIGLAHASIPQPRAEAEVRHLRAVAE
ncbi:MAG: bifunctional diguanylate cyclase/phosphodiesterase [Mycobacteriales bacterium]